MDLPPLLFLGVLLTVWALRNVWLEGSLFAEWRARTELAWPAVTCRLCLSCWLALAAALVLLLLSWVPWLSPALLPGSLLGGWMLLDSWTGRTNLREPHGTAPPEPEPDPADDPDALP